MPDRAYAVRDPTWRRTLLSKLRTSLTYANVVSTLCLFIVLGGGAYAATTITGKNVKNSSLTGTDIKNSSLTTTDVKNGSLLSADFKAGHIPAGAQGPKGDTGAAGATGADGQDAFTDAGVATSADPFSFSSETHADVPGMSTNITVPAGRTATLIANFSAESTCVGSGADNCSVRVLIDNAEMAPAVGLNFAFDSAADGNVDAAYESNAIVRSMTGVGAGSHTVKVQAAVNDITSYPSPPNFTLDDLVLAVQAIED